MKKKASPNGHIEARSRIATAKLNRATTLDLSGLGLVTLPPGVGDLTTLKRIDLSDNQLTALPLEIGSLIALTEIDLNVNQLVTLPREIGSLTALEILIVRDNQLSTLPPEIGALTALKFLDVGNNQITKIPPEIGQIKSLKTIYLYMNQLTSLPVTLRDLQKSLDLLSLFGNPKLGLNQEILGTDNPAMILDAYFGAKRKSSEPLNEVKLLLVGHGRVGKTCLSKALRGEPHDEREKETPGIERHVLELPSGKSMIRAHVCDFGGQEFLHHTHQFFFSERSIYVIVLIGRQGRAEPEAEYWLRLVRTYGPGSPVLIVLNQIKAHPFDIDEHYLKENYPEVKGVLKTDCDPSFGIQQLRQEIAKLARSMPSVRQKIDRRWSQVRERLEQQKANYVRFDEYQAICTAEKVTQIDQQETLADILNCLGIALNYRNDPRLRDTSVLKPQWLVDGIYKILRWIKKKKTGGVLRRSDLPKALPGKREYPPEMHEYLLKLMVKFELCFALNDVDEQYLVPGLLSANQPQELKKFLKPEARHVQFRYDGLRPPGLIPQFVVRSHTLSDGQPRWQRGVVLRRGGAEALVRADPEGRLTDLFALGGRDDRVWLTEYVQAEMQILNGKNPVTTWVESEENPGVWSEWEVLRDDRGTDERTEKRVGGETVTINPKRTLEEVESPEATVAKAKRGEVERALPLFVCYAHADEQMVKRLLPTLRILANRGYITAWRDTDLVPGEDWDETIKKRLMDAEIVISMVSRDFLASAYISTEERPISMQQHAYGLADIVPVLLKRCTYEKEDFAKFELLPFKGKTLVSYRSHDTAWELIERGIELAVKKRRETSDSKRSRNSLISARGPTGLRRSAD